MIRWLTPPANGVPGFQPRRYAQLQNFRPGIERQKLDRLLGFRWPGDHLEIVCAERSQRQADF